MKRENRMQIKYALKCPEIMRKHSLRKDFIALSYNSLHKHMGESVA